MQVKKFEAKSMKEALELVKTHLGPEAIILSAKDTHRGFGLMGEKSVEVTAAVSEETLRRKKIAETKLREDLRQRFQQIPASKQRQFINKVFQEATTRETVGAGHAAITAEDRAQTKGMRYIDIEDENLGAPIRHANGSAISGNIRAGNAGPNISGNIRQAGVRPAQQQGRSASQMTQAQTHAQAQAQARAAHQHPHLHQHSQARQPHVQMQQQGGYAPQGRTEAQRVRSAAERARLAGQEVFGDDVPAAPARSARVSAAAAAAASAAMATFDAPPAQNAVRHSIMGAATGSLNTASGQTQIQNQNPASAAGYGHGFPMSATASADVRSLENQVRELKAIVERFQQVPQIPMTMHPGAEQGLSFELSGIYQRLTTQGMNPSLVTSLLRKAQKEIDPETLKKPALVDAWVVRRLLDTIEVTVNPTATRYHVFAGSTGQGKTTTLVKFASHLMLKEKRTIAIISLDTMKLGAADQLRMYAQILNVPFAVVRTPEEWRVVEQKLAHVQHILVDCPGLSLSKPEEREWLQKILPPSTVSKTTHFVQSVIGRDEETLEIASRYQAIGFNDVIFTRLDESSRQGMILNFQDRFKVPLHSFAFGSRIPEDFEFASKERVVDFLFKLSKVTRREEA